MKKNQNIITILVFLLAQVALYAQETELFQYVNEINIKKMYFENSVLSSIKNRASSMSVYVVQFQNLYFLQTKSIRINLPGISVLSERKYIKLYSQTNFT